MVGADAHNVMSGQSNADINIQFSSYNGGCSNP